MEYCRCSVLHGNRIKGYRSIMILLANIRVRFKKSRLNSPNKYCLSHVMHQSIFVELSFLLLVEGNSRFTSVFLGISRKLFFTFWAERMVKSLKSLPINCTVLAISFSNTHSRMQVWFNDIKLWNPKASSLDVVIWYASCFKFQYSCSCLLNLYDYNGRKALENVLCFWNDFFFLNSLEQL